MAKKIIVTGGTGFIGSHLVNVLLERGYEVSVFDVKEEGRKNVDYTIGDIRNQEHFQKYVDVIKPYCIVHLAGEIRGGYETLYTANVLGTENVLKSFEGRCIFMSTGMVYQGNEVPYTEEQPTNPQDHYPKTKKLAEDLCIRRKNTAIIRASVVYGPRQKSPMFISVLKQALKAKKGAFQMTKGEQKRDFLHVKDLIHAICLLIEHPYSGIINIGSGRNISLKETIEIARNLVGDFPVEYTVPYREHEMMDYLLDISKAKTLLNWEPRITLEEGLKDLLMND